MKVVHVIPIQRGIGVEELTYFTIRDVTAGALVTIPLRGSYVPGLVVSAEDVQDTRAQLRSQDFQLKKMGPEAPKQLFLSSCAEAARAVANFYATTTGAVLSSLLPKVVIEKYASLPALESDINTSIDAHVRRYAVQADFAERCTTYKNIARESLAKKETVFFLVPRQYIGERLRKEIEKGIEKHVVCALSGMTPKKTLEAWKTAIGDRPLVIIGTPQFLTLPRVMHTIVIEAEGDDNYVRVERPYIDMRVVAEIVSELTNARLIYGDMMLRAQTFAELDAGIIESYAPLQQKQRDTTLSLIHKPQEEAKKVFSSELQQKILQLHAHGVHQAFIVARKNIATSVICADCGTRCICSTCGGAQRLSTRVRTSERILMCARCGATEDANITCKKCNSWKLKMYGVTTDSVARELAVLLPNSEIYVFEAGKKTNAELLQKLKKSKSQLIVVGTTALIPHLQDFHTAIIPSLEGFLSAPTYSADEDAVRMIAEMRSLIHHGIIIQTGQQASSPIISHIADGELTQFLRDELTLRKTLHLPPYTTEITITITGKREVVIAEVKSMLQKLHEWRPRPQKDLVRISAVSVSHTTKLYVQRSSWPSEVLVSILRSLPPSVSIRVT